MRVLFLTSDDAVRGLTSDDGFEIGRISTATIGFVIAMTVVGGVLGSLYGFERHFVDGSTGAARLGIPVAVGLLAGATIVHTDGVDFRFLDPLWLSVGSFVVLPALWAATLVGLTERALHSARLGPIPAIDERPLGRIGTLFAWTVIATMSIIGLVDLISDYRDLT